MASLIRCLGAAVLLLSLFLCQWCCTHRSNVRRVPVSGECPGHPAALCCHGSFIPLEPHGWHHPLWHWLCSCLLRRRVCPIGSMVGLWVCYLHRKHHHLAWGGRLLVEDDWAVVSTTLTATFLCFLLFRSSGEGILFLNLRCHRCRCPQSFVVDMIATHSFSWYRYICSNLPAANCEARVQFLTCKVNHIELCSMDLGDHSLSMCP